MNGSSASPGGVGIHTTEHLAAPVAGCLHMRKPKGLLGLIIQDGHGDVAVHHQDRKGKPVYEGLEGQRLTEVPYESSRNHLVS